MSGVAVRFDPLRSLAYTSITTSYIPLGAIVGHLERIVHFTNTTDSEMIFSFDAVNDHVVVPANAFVLYDFSSNAQPGYGFFLAIGTQVYVKQATGGATTGSVYLTMVYGQGE